MPLPLETMAGHPALVDLRLRHASAVRSRLPVVAPSYGDSLVPRSGGSEGSAFPPPRKRADVNTRGLPFTSSVRQYRSVNTCALCGHDKQLVKSHIVPEFLYTDLYDSLHSYSVISTDPHSRKQRRKKGIYEFLLCCDCETHTARYEQYASRVFNGGTELEISDEPNYLTVGNLEYSRFKLFQMSVLWRCGVSKRPEFSATQLGPHGENLRRMLRDGRPGASHEYGCILILPASYDVTRQLVYPPESVTLEGHRCYRASLGGLWWLYVVSSHSKSFPYRQLFLSQDGFLRIPKEARWSTDFILRLGQDLKRDAL